jgi:hypothetical protein
MLEQVGRGVIDDRPVAAPDDAETAALKKRARAAARGPAPGGPHEAGAPGLRRGQLTGGSRFRTIRGTGRPRYQAASQAPARARPAVVVDTFSRTPGRNATGLVLRRTDRDP